MRLSMSYPDSVKNRGFDKQKSGHQVLGFIDLGVEQKP